MEKWCLQAQDVDQPHTVDVYVESHTSVVPLGLLPGAVVVFRRAIRRVSAQRNNIYIMTTHDTDVCVLSLPVARSPSLLLDADTHMDTREDKQTHTEAEAETDEKANTNAHANDHTVTLSPRKLQNMEICYLIDIPQQPTTLNQTIMAFKCTLIEFGFWELGWRCNLCKIALFPTKPTHQRQPQQQQQGMACALHGPRSAEERVFRCQAQLMIDDSSGTALVFIGDEVLWQLLGFSPRCVLCLGCLCLLFVFGVVCVRLCVIGC